MAFLFFLAFVITAVMLDRKGAMTVISWSLYRGLIFGDGAGLDNMGFAIEGSWQGEASDFIEDQNLDGLSWLLTVMAILGTVTFIVSLGLVMSHEQCQQCGQDPEHDHRHL